MNQEEDFTIERLSKRYADKSQFDLVIYSIKLAIEMIKSGRDPRVKVYCQNKASQVLAEMSAGKDFLPNVDVEANLHEDKMKLAV